MMHRESNEIYDYDRVCDRCGETQCDKDGMETKGHESINMCAICKGTVCCGCATESCCSTMLFTRECDLCERTICDPRGFHDAGPEDIFRWGCG
jgi:hypothetical protein